MLDSHTWKQAQRLAPRILNDHDVLARQLRQARLKLEKLTAPGGKLEPMAREANLLPGMVWTYATRECLGPSYRSVSLALSALNYLTASTNVLDLLKGRDPVDLVFSSVCRTIALDLKDFQRWQEERPRKTEATAEDS